MSGGGGGISGRDLDMIFFFIAQSQNLRKIRGFTYYYGALYDY